MGLAAVGIGLVAASTLVAAAGQIKSANAAKSQAEYQEQVARNNEVIAQQKADDARKIGAVEERRRRLQTSQLIGSQRATLAANGIEVDQGSALDLTADTAAIGELDALTIRNNAERQALGFENQAAEFAGEARLESARARNEQTEGFLAAGGTVLTGGSRVAGKWYDFQKDS